METATTHATAAMEATASTTAMPATSAATMLGKGRREIEDASRASISAAAGLCAKVIASFLWESLIIFPYRHYQIAWEGGFPMTKQLVSRETFPSPSPAPRTQMSTKALQRQSKLLILDIRHLDLQRFRTLRRRSLERDQILNDLQTLDSVFPATRRRH